MRYFSSLLLAVAVAFGSIALSGAFVSAPNQSMTKRESIQHDHVTTLYGISNDNADDDDEIAISIPDNKRKRRRWQHQSIIYLRRRLYRLSFFFLHPASHFHHVYHALYCQYVGRLSHIYVVFLAGV